MSSAGAAPPTAAAGAPPPGAPPPAGAAVLETLHRALTALITFEAQYVERMHTLIDQVIDPLEHQRPKLLLEPVVTTLFAAIKAIEALHGQMLQRLVGDNVAAENEDVLNVLADLFIEYSPMLRVYADYCRTVNAVSVLVQRTRDDAVLAVLASQADTDDTLPEGVGNARGNFLMQLNGPREHVLQYRARLEAVLRVFGDFPALEPGADPEAAADPDAVPRGYRRLQLAMSLVDDSAQMLNDVIMAQQHEEDLTRVEEALGGGASVVAPGRRLVREGVLYMVSKRGLKRRYVYLFNDVVMLCEPERGLIGGGSRARPYALKQTLELRDCATDDRVTEAQHGSLACEGHEVQEAWGFQLRSKLVSFVFFAASERAKSAWVADFDANIESTGGGTRRLAPVWVSDESTGECQECIRPFSMVRRRHHCRRCGHVVCASCSTHSMFLPNIDSSRVVRVCDSCWAIVQPKAQRSAATTTLAAKWTDQPPRRQGWLHKKKMQRSRTVFGSSWARFWCVCKGHSLFYYASDAEGLAPSGDVPLPYTEARPFPSYGANCIELSVPVTGARYYFVAQSSDDQRAWIEALGAAADMGGKPASTSTGRASGNAAAAAAAGAGANANAGTPTTGTGRRSRRLGSIASGEEAKEEARAWYSLMDDVKRSTRVRPDHVRVLQEVVMREVDYVGRLRRLLALVDPRAADSAASASEDGDSAGSGAGAGTGSGNGPDNAWRLSPDPDLAVCLFCVRHIISLSSQLQTLLGPPLYALMQESPDLRVNYPRMYSHMAALSAMLFFLHSLFATHFQSARAALVHSPRLATVVNDEVLALATLPNFHASSYYVSLQRLVACRVREADGSLAAVPPPASPPARAKRPSSLPQAARARMSARHSGGGGLPLQRGSSSRGVLDGVQRELTRERHHSSLPAPMMPIRPRSSGSAGSSAGSGSGPGSGPGSGSGPPPIPASAGSGPPPIPAGVKAAEAGGPPPIPASVAASVGAASPPPIPESAGGPPPIPASVTASVGAAAPPPIPESAGGPPPIPASSVQSTVPAGAKPAFPASLAAAVAAKAAGPPPVPVQSTGPPPIPVTAEAAGPPPIPATAEAAGPPPIPVTAEAAGPPPVPATAEAAGPPPIPAAAGVDAKPAFPASLAAAVAAKAAGPPPVPVQSTGPPPIPATAEAAGPPPIPVTAEAPGPPPIPATVGAEAKPAFPASVAAAVAAKAAGPPPVPVQSTGPPPVPAPAEATGPPPIPATAEAAGPPPIPATAEAAGPPPIPATATDEAKPAFPASVAAAVAAKAAEKPPDIDTAAGRPAFPSSVLNQSSQSSQSSPSNQPKTKSRSARPSVAALGGEGVGRVAAMRAAAERGLAVQMQLAKRVAAGEQVILSPRAQTTSSHAKPPPIPSWVVASLPPERDEALMRAFTRVAAAAEFIERTIRRQEDLSQLRAIQDAFGPSVNIMRDSRFLVRQGELHKICRRKVQPYHFFLFNDLVVYAKPVSATRYQVHRFLPLGTCSVSNVSLPPADESTESKQEEVVDEEQIRLRQEAEAAAYPPGVVAPPPPPPPAQPAGAAAGAEAKKQSRRAPRRSKGLVPDLAAVALQEEKKGEAAQRADVVPTQYKLPPALLHAIRTARKDGPCSLFNVASDDEDDPDELLGEAAALERAEARDGRAFQITSVSKSFIVLALSAEDKAAWLRDIRECFRLMREEEAERARERGELADGGDEDGAAEGAGGGGGVVPTLKAGYLHKKARGVRHHAWQRKWFVLQGSSLMTFASSKADRATRSYDVRDMTVGVATEKTQKYPYAFKLDPAAVPSEGGESAPLMFYAESGADMEAWMGAFGKAVSGEWRAAEAARQSQQSTAAPVWMPDASTTRCEDCNALFFVLNRRHHCRHCGAVVCNSCSQHRWLLVGSAKPVRVCNSCYDLLQATPVGGAPGAGAEVRRSRLI